MEEGTRRDGVESIVGILHVTRGGVVSRGVGNVLKSGAFLEEVNEVRKRWAVDNHWKLEVFLKV